MHDTGSAHRPATHCGRSPLGAPGNTAGRFPGGGTLEMEIPFKTLRYPAKPQGLDETRMDALGALGNTSASARERVSPAAGTRAARRRGRRR